MKTLFMQAKSVVEACNETKSPSEIKATTSEFVKNLSIFSVKNVEHPFLVGLAAYYVLTSEVERDLQNVPWTPNRQSASIGQKSFSKNALDDCANSNFRGLKKTIESSADWFGYDFELAFDDERCRNRKLFACAFYAFAKALLSDDIDNFNGIRNAHEYEVNVEDIETESIMSAMYLFILIQRYPNRFIESFHGVFANQLFEDIPKITNNIAAFLWNIHVATNRFGRHVELSVKNMSEFTDMSAQIPHSINFFSCQCIISGRDLLSQSKICVDAMEEPKDIEPIYDKFPFED